jgi:hypothetical protein
LFFFSFFDLMDLWSLRGALSKLKFTLKIIFENNEWVWLQISWFLLIHFCEWCALESS